MKWLKENIIKIALIAIFAFLCGWLLKPTPPAPNSTLEYGETGLPKNCRAIIAENIESWQQDEYSADEVLSSIQRNCGRNGRSW